MAEKQASVYVVDLGRSMGRKHNGRSQTDLEYAMQYVWDKITSTVPLYLSEDYEGLIANLEDLDCQRQEDRHRRRPRLPHRW